MPSPNNSTEQLIAQAKLGEESALVNLIGQVGPRLRRAIDAELEAVHHDLDATQMWNEIQEEAKQRVGEFEGATETEFEAWAERLALRHIRYSLGGRAVNIETIVNAPKTDTLSTPAPISEVSDSTPNPSTSPDPNDTIAPGKQATAKFDPNGTIAPGNQQAGEFDPNATIGPGDGDTIAPNAFATPLPDPNATITDLDSIPLAPQTTQIFGDYEILETIAKGGMGVVYKARQRSLNRIVALKMILAGQFADDDDIDRFHVEAEAAGKLRHANIVGIYEVGECEGQHYFSMEYIEGRSLGDLVREHPLAPRAAATFVKTISEAMYYAHEEGVLHRDLKPSNVLVDDNDVPLITDFGLAKRTEEQSQRTAAGSVLGTPSYMPPEQASGKLDLISERSDVYSIGAILYELITGKPPFGAANPWETIKQVINNEPVSPRLLNNSVPADLETICLKCLQKDQDRRYGTAQDLAEELQRFLAGEPIQARPISVVERSVRWCYRNPWPTVALAVMLLGVVGTSVGLVQAIIAQRQAEESRYQLLVAINELFTAWGDVKLLNEPGMEQIRRDLLATAKDLYERMGNQLGADPKIQEGLGEAYFRLGRLMFDLESFADASQSLKSGLDIREQLHTENPDHENRLRALGEIQNLYGNALEILAVAESNTLNAARTELDAAETYYEKAIAVRQQLAERFQDKLEYERQLLNSQMNQAMIQQRIGGLLDDHDQSAEAEPFYVDARSGLEGVQARRGRLLERLVESSDIQLDVTRDLAEGFYNLAKVTLRLDDFVATEEHLTAARREFDTLLNAFPKSLEYQYSKTNCWLLVGEAKFEQLLPLDDNNPAKYALADDAVNAYENAAEILKQLASRSPRVAKYRRDLARVYFQIGEIHFTVLEDRKALAAYQSAETILVRMVEDFSFDGDQRVLAQVYLLIGEILAIEEPKEALVAYLSAEKFLTQLIDEFSDDSARLDLAHAYLDIGQIQFSNKLYEEALAAYRSAEKILARFVEGFPKDTYLQHLLDQAQRGIADVTSAAAEAESTTPAKEPD